MQAVCEMNLPYTSYGVPQGLGLTYRERRVISLVTAGFTDQDLAATLNISQARVQRHLTDVCEKLGVANRIELVLFAVDQGLTAEE
jgi:DNA-binding NarL/FixJ family response regulator